MLPIRGLILKHQCRILVLQLVDVDRALTTFPYSEIVKSSVPPPKSYKLNLTDREMKNESTKKTKITFFLFFVMYWRLYRLKLNDLSIKETMKGTWSNC